MFSQISDIEQCGCDWKTTHQNEVPSKTLTHQNAMHFKSFNTKIACLTKLLLGSKLTEDYSYQDTEDNSYQDTEDTCKDDDIDKIVYDPNIMKMILEYGPYYVFERQKPNCIIISSSNPMEHEDCIAYDSKMNPICRLYMQEPKQEHVPYRIEPFTLHKNELQHKLHKQGHSHQFLNEIFAYGRFGETKFGLRASLCVGIAETFLFLFLVLSFFVGPPLFHLGCLFFVYRCEQDHQLFAASA